MLSSRSFFISCCSAVMLIASCGTLAPSRTAFDPADECYRLRYDAWTRPGEIADGPPPVYARPEALRLARASTASVPSQPRWAQRGDSLIIQSSGSVMEGWSLQLARTATGASGFIDFVHDVPEASRRGSVTAEAVPCAQLPSAVAVMHDLSALPWRGGSEAANEGH